MGMSDRVFCEVALPDGFEAVGVDFATKCLPESGHCSFRITAQGRFMDEWGRDCEPDGYITFYTYDEHADPDSADEVWSCRREYRAEFRQGQLVGIRRMSEALLEAEPRHTFRLESFRWFAWRGNNPDF